MYAHNFYVSWLHNKAVGKDQLVRIITWVILSMLQSSYMMHVLYLEAEQSCLGEELSLLEYCYYVQRGGHSWSPKTPAVWLGEYSS